MDSLDPSAETRVEDTLGALGTFALALGLVLLLWIQLPDLSPRLRGGVLVGCMLVFLSLGRRWTRPGASGSAPAPATGRSLGTLGVLCFLLGLGELARVEHLPPSDLSALAVALVMLLAADGLGSTVLACMGALSLQSTLQERVCLELGTTGGMLTDAIFPCVGVAAGLATLGLLLFASRRSASGRGLASWGCWSVLFYLGLLSVAGPEYHGWLDADWLNPFYYLLFVLMGLLTVRLSGAMDNRPLSAAATLALCCRVLYTYAYYAADPLPAGLFFLLAGVVLVVVGKALERFRTGHDAVGPSAPHAPRSAPRPRSLAVARALALGVVAAALLKGAWNRAMAGGPEIPAPVIHGGELPRFLFPFVDLEQITPPPGDRTPGMALDVWLEVEGVRPDPESPEVAGVLLFRRSAAVPAGAPPPEGLDPARSYRVPARWIDCRLVGGAPVRMVLPRYRWLFELPPRLRGPARELDLRVGGLGYPYPAGKR